MLRPLELMLGRVERARSDSDTALFYELLYAGEVVVRLTTAALIACIQDDKERHRYRLLHTLIRADGLGEWSRALMDAVSGPASQHLTNDAREDRRTLSERLGPGSWQHDTNRYLSTVLRTIDSNVQEVASRTSATSWYTQFSELRNKTRGHGSPTPATCARVAAPLEESIRLLVDNVPLFKRPWAYLHRNLSGRYRAVPLGTTEKAFEELKGQAGENRVYPNGIYIHVNGPQRVDLIHSNLDASDFFFPNGAFNGKRYELHSPITDDRLEGDASPYVASASDLPESETHGLGLLDIIGKTWSNLPSVPPDYVPRADVENDVLEKLANDRHAIVTLVGRGGIGKTSTALKTLQSLALQDRFELIVWFSARDIDLLASGPKLVQPQVLTEGDIAREFVRLVGIEGSVSKDKRPESLLADNLRKSEFGGPILFVFDNFETIRNPVDVFTWVDTNIRLPNKALITSRFRDFKADYPITIAGMTPGESRELIGRTAVALGIKSLITTAYIDELVEQSDGHPYVIKIILGEVASAGSVSRPERIVARKEDILDALFERTFANLTPLASRIFLTLSGWRSLVPQLALEAALLRDGSENIDPSAAVDELVRMSLVQRQIAQDGSDFLEVPFVAAVFGSRKLTASPIKLVIENDLKLLHDLGPTTTSSFKQGLQPRILNLFRRVADRVYQKRVPLSEVKPVLELIAQSYVPAWLWLSDLILEARGAEGGMDAAEYLRRFLENEPDAARTGPVWERLANLYRAEGDVVAACGAFARAFAGTEAPLEEISNTANWLNNNREAIASMDATDKAAIFGSLAGLMERRLQSATPTDLSRLAWLHLHAGDERRAREVAEMGLFRDRGNVHCRRLVERLGANK